MRGQVHHQILIVGGGTAGITAGARLSKALKGSSIAILEPCDKHYYQPLWTLVGAGVTDKETTEREEADQIPKNVFWIRDRAVEFHPEENHVVTAEGKKIYYDYLVIAPGIQIDWHKVKGLRESIGREGVCSIYAYEQVDATWETIRNLRRGNALFTHPSTPIKCGGAPQKIMYLAEDYFRISGVREQIKVVFLSAGKAIFAIPKYAKTLNEVIARKGIETRFQWDLTEIRSGSKEAVFRHMEKGDELVLQYDMIHVTPPMSAPDFVKRSPLANADGWVDVDKYTLQHKKYENIFSLGDASSLPTSKTGAAVRKQAPVLVGNLVAHMKGEPLPARYDGYTSCPLITGYGKVVLAEFDYDLNPKETFPFDQSKERYSMYLLTRYLLPPMYWHGMLRGRI